MKAAAVLLGFATVLGTFVATTEALRRLAPASHHAAAARWLSAHRAAWRGRGALPRSLRCVTPRGALESVCEASDPGGRVVLRCVSAPCRCAPAPPFGGGS